MFTPNYGGYAPQTADNGGMKPNIPLLSNKNMGGLSPLKVAGQAMFTMSPREHALVSRRATTTNIGIEGYETPIIGVQPKSIAYKVQQQKKKSVIEMEASRKMLVPSPS